MIEVFGDLWNYQADARCITTNGYIKINGEAVMGRGCAKEAAQMWPDLPKTLGFYLRRYGVQTMWITPPDLFVFPVKHHWKELANFTLIRKSAIELKAIVDNNPYLQTVVLPRPGCGNGGRNWDEVKLVIQDVLDDRFHIIDKEPISVPFRP